jgi:SAM-dependent methyltransferase
MIHPPEEGMPHPWWDHRDWYDVHDNTSIAGPDREPEHYREFVVTLPPIGPEDHVVDIGAGTGKLSGLLADAYPDVGRITLIEPNESKLDRARSRLAARLGPERVRPLRATLGEGATLPAGEASLAIVGSVLMPALVGRGGTLRDGRLFVVRVLAEVRSLLRPGGWLFDLETLAMPWDVGAEDGPVRRLTLPELNAALEAAGLDAAECVYRFRDRVVVRARRPSA